MEHVPVVIIGAGQAGLATSYHLTRLGVPHAVLERGHVGEAWRRRWRKFCLVTPNWSITLPGAEYIGDDPHGFMPRDDFIGHLEGWAKRFRCPVRTGVEVLRVRPGFELETSAGLLRADAVVVATSTYQRPKRPPIAASMPERLIQLDVEDYQCPGDLPTGDVLVVGSGQSGCQIADELRQSGRGVWLAVGRSGRLPRRYRGRDIIEWMRDYGFLDRRPEQLDHPRDRFAGDPHVSGRDGGRTLSLHDFHACGIHLLGHLEDIDGERLILAADLALNMHRADEAAIWIRRWIDDYLETSGRVAPPPTREDMIGEPKNGWTIDGQLDLNLSATNIQSVIWATGFAFDFGWIEGAPLDELGYPMTHGGISDKPGLYFVGLNYMTKRKSGIIYGVSEDAARIAWHIQEHHAAGEHP